MSGIRTGNFFINSDLSLRTLQLPTDQYRQMRKKSILLALNWLEENVLNRDDAGHHLREKTRNGITFDDKMHSYLMNSCIHWLEKVNGDRRQAPRDRKDRMRPYSTIHQTAKSPPDIVERPMTCPGREIKISPIRVMNQEPKIDYNNRHLSNHDRHHSTHNRHHSTHNNHHSTHDRHHSTHDRHHSTHDRYHSTHDRHHSTHDKYRSTRGRHHSKDIRHHSRNVQSSENIREPVSTQPIRPIRTYRRRSPPIENVYESKTYRYKPPHRLKNRTEFRLSIAPIRPKVIPKTGIYRCK